VLWGGWLVVTALAFSLGQGIIHEYYSVALAPAIGAIVGIGATTFWARRDNPLVRVLLGVVLATTALWSFVLLQRTPDWLVPLRAVILVSGLVAALVVAVVPALRGRAAVAVAIAVLTIGFAAPAAYTLSTVRQTHGGALPTAGPAGAASGPGSLGARGGAPGGGGFRAGGFAGGGFQGGRFQGGAFPGGGFGGTGGPTFTPPGFANGGGPTGRGANGGGAGGLLNGSNASAAVTALFRQSAGFRWTAAAIGANNVAGYQLASGQAVMAIGGFNGTDPTPTLAQFQQYVRDGRIH
jgi:hypothetical protein